MNDMNTVAGVEAELEQLEADYKEARKAALVDWQLRRKHLRAWLDVVIDKAILKEREEAEEGGK